MSELPDENQIPGYRFQHLQWFDNVLQDL